MQTDYAVFLFDNGEKNMIASMLCYARGNDPSTLEKLDFKVIFMGASIDAMDHEPFSHFPHKLLHYKQLGIEETIDYTWKRNRKLDSTSLTNLTNNIKIQKKVWLGVSCSIFEQILQIHSNIEATAIRDNPSPNGDTDYFKIAREVQDTANSIAVPSVAAFNDLDSVNKKIAIIGQAPIEEFQEDAKYVDKVAIIDRLGLNDQLPIIVYAGTYGDGYKECFEKFLAIFPTQGMQLLIVPHPRYKGIIETEVCGQRQFKIVGEFMDGPIKKIKMVEALTIADAVVTADATSTIVFQANALRKKVFYVNSACSEVGQRLCDIKLIYRISSKDEFLKAVEKGNSSVLGQDVFKLLGIPRSGAKLLWNEFLN